MLLGSPFSPIFFANFSNVLDKFFSADSTLARTTSTFKCDRLGMNRSLVHVVVENNSDDKSPPPPPLFLVGVRSSGGERDGRLLLL